MQPASRPAVSKDAHRGAKYAFGRAVVSGERPAGSVLPAGAVLAMDTCIIQPALREAPKLPSGRSLVRTARRYAMPLVYHLAPASRSPIFGSATSRSHAIPALARWAKEMRIGSPSIGTKPSASRSVSISQRMPGFFETRL